MIDDFYNEKRHSKNKNGSINTKNHNKKFLTFFLSQHINNENEGSKKYHIKAKFKKFDVYLITYCKKGDK